MCLAGQTDRRTDIEAGLFPRPQLLQLQRRRPRVKTRNRVSLASTYNVWAGREMVLPSHSRETSVAAAAVFSDTGFGEFQVQVTVVSLVTWLFCKAS